MNLKEAIDLIDPEIDGDLKKYGCIHIGCIQIVTSHSADFKLRGRLSQMKREVERLNKLEGNGIYEVSVIKEYIEALNILIKHFEDVLK